MNILKRLKIFGPQNLRGKVCAMFCNDLYCEVNGIAMYRLSSNDATNFLSSKSYSKVTMNRNQIHGAE
jgi:hypothetical protein